MIELTAEQVDAAINLRAIPVPAEVTAVRGCDCGGSTLHRVDCTIYSLTVAERERAHAEAEQRVAEWNAALNRAVAGRSGGRE